MKVGRCSFDLLQVCGSDPAATWAEGAQHVEGEGDSMSHSGRKVLLAVSSDIACIGGTHEFAAS